MSTASVAPGEQKGGIFDNDMLRRQLALGEPHRRSDRVSSLNTMLGKRRDDPRIRCRLLRDAITLGERQEIVRRHTREACPRRQAIFLFGLSKD